MLLTLSLLACFDFSDDPPSLASDVLRPHIPAAPMKMPRYSCDVDEDGDGAFACWSVAPFTGEAMDCEWGVTNDPSFAKTPVVCVVPSGVILKTDDWM